MKKIKLGTIILFILSMICLIGMIISSYYPPTALDGSRIDLHFGLGLISIILMVFSLIFQSDKDL